MAAHFLLHPLSLLPTERWGLCPTPMNLGQAYSCFVQQNRTEMASCQLGVILRRTGNFSPPP